MTYAVKSRFPSDTREQDIANFKFLKDAQLFIRSKLLTDRDEGTNNLIYKLYDFDMLIEEFDPRKMDLSQISTGAAPEKDAGQQGQGARSSFNPTPLNTTPTPSGTPKKWIKDEDDEKGKY